MTPDDSSTSPVHPARLALGAVFLLVMAVLLFARLGHYALWDDETYGALGAKAVMRTGDTSVWCEHGNIVAFRGGMMVRDFHDRFTPPLPTYLAALSFLLLGVNAWAARLPFAIFGLATYALILWWMRRGRFSWFVALLLGLLFNVSLILYFRQCRYYGPDIFFTVAIAFIYWRWKSDTRDPLVMSLLSVLLFASNFMNYLALSACLAVDYLVWRRKERPMNRRSALLLLVPQVILNGAIACVWNPLRTPPMDQMTGSNTLWDRFHLFLWYWRDMSRGEFLVLPLLVLALVISLVQRRTWLGRGCLALSIYTLVISLVSPQLVKITFVADVRYLAPVIPLALAIEVGALQACLPRRGGWVVVAALLVFGTNLIYGAPLFGTSMRCTLASYMKELIHPVPEPYSPTAAWINEHVAPDSSIWVQPEYATYPLMFHAPNALYAWQLAWPPRADFTGLPRIHFIGQTPPDYLVAFGPYTSQVATAIQWLNRPDVHYEPAAMINTYWQDKYRPELFWHHFEAITNYDPQTQAVYIFRRTQPPITLDNTNRNQ